MTEYRPVLSTQGECHSNRKPQCPLCHSQRIYTHPNIYTKFAIYIKPSLACAKCILNSKQQVCIYCFDFSSVFHSTYALISPCLPQSISSSVRTSETLSQSDYQSMEGRIYFGVASTLTHIQMNLLRN